ncbi:MAG: hypothetical protein JST49_08955 [Bacteroidetes bacterium]|nr:hypothetical protein [Bacteroidota bacterium]
MGERISFYKCNDCSYTATVKNNYARFKQWYLSYALSVLEEYKEEFGTKELKEYLLLHDNIDAMNAQLIDEYCVEFMYAYDDAMRAEQQNLFSLFGPSMNKWRYKESTVLIANTKDEDLIYLWSYIVGGRSLSAQPNFESVSQEVSVGYITATERQLLQSKLQHYFSSASPAEEGIRYVLQMMERTANENCDVVITIDGVDNKK